ncbi:MAG: TolC family protein [Proteobacteria bacterium]|nr:TolC family protein [Pseudomonadota bacterium]MBU1418004.1 TolC family protein [Pseudomonadota bacterium]MBU1455945.1 TolC family protein [Pseudomonadota bacterium]
MRLTLKALSFIIILCSTGMPKNGYSTEPASGPILGLEDFIEIALRNNPAVAIARSQVLASEGRKTQAVSGYLPRLTAKGEAGRIHINDLTPVDEAGVMSGNLSANQLIYDFGNTTGAISASVYNIEAARAQLNSVGSDLIYQVKAAYYSVLEKHHLIMVANEQVKSYQMHYDRAKEYFKAGVKSKIDVTNAQVELTDAKLQLLQSRFALKSAKVALEKVVGTNPGEGTYLIQEQDLDLKQFINFLAPMPVSREELLQTATLQRPDLQQAQKAINSAESLLTAAQGGFWPTLGATASYDTYNTDLPTLQDQWQIGIALDWEFFSGFRTQGEVAEAKSSLRSYKAQMRDIELTVTQEVTNNFLLAEEQRESVFLANEILTLAEENLDLADQRYKTGLGDMIEFNDAQLRIAKARSNLVTAYYGYNTALASLEKAIGIYPDMNEPETKEIQK